MVVISERLTRSLLILMALPATAMGFALSVQIAALSWLLNTKFGLDIYDIGLVWAAGPIAGVIGQVLVGLISDEAWFWGGRRRPFILIGGTLSALSLLALPSLGVLSAALGLEGIVGIALIVALTLDLSINISFNPTRAIIADLTTEGEDRTRGYTWMQTVSGSFGVLAYLIGAQFGNIALIYVGAGLVLVFSLIPPFFLQEPRTLGSGAAETRTQETTSFIQMLLAIQPLWAILAYDVYALIRRLAGVKPDHLYAEYLCLAGTASLIALVLRPQRREGTRGPIRPFQRIVAAHSFSWIGVQTMFVFMFAFLSHRFTDLSEDGLGQSINIAFLILNAVAAFLPALVLTRLASRLGRVRTHALCLFIMTLGFSAGYGFGHSLSAIFVTMAVLGVGWAAMISLPFAIMSEHVNPRRIGLFMGLFNLSVVLPQLLVSLGIALLLDRMADKGVMFLMAAGALAVSALLWLTVPTGARAGTKD